MSTIADGSKTQPRRGHILQRTTLVTSRLLDFFTRKELVAQTGHEPHA